MLFLAGCSSSTSSNGGGSGGGAGGGTGGTGGTGGGSLKCNNGTLETDEVCEGFELRGKTCVSEGFDTGTLKCATNCTLDTSGCQKCGDGKATGTEFCDGSDFRGKTCATLFDGGFQGTITCEGACTTINASQCKKPPGRDEACSILDGCPAPLVCALVVGTVATRCTLYCDAAAIGTQGTCPSGETCRDGGYELEGGRVAPPAYVQCPQLGCGAGFTCPDAGSTIQSYCVKPTGACSP